MSTVPTHIILAENANCKEKRARCSMAGSSTRGGGMAAPDDVCHDSESATAYAVTMYPQLPAPQFLQRPLRQYMQSLPELQNLQCAFPRPNAPAIPPLPSALARLSLPTHEKPR